MEIQALVGNVGSAPLFEELQEDWGASAGDDGDEILCLELKDVRVGDRNRSLKHWTRTRVNSHYHLGADHNHTSSFHNEAAAHRFADRIAIPFDRHLSPIADESCAVRDQK